jgi:hypothetical protein
MKEQLTVTSATSHTKGMPENTEEITPSLPESPVVEMPVKTEVIPSSTGVSAISEQRKLHLPVSRSEEDIHEEARVRSELERVQIKSSGSSMSEFNRIMSSSTLASGEQDSLRQIWNDTEPSKRVPLLKSLKEVLEVTDKNNPAEDLEPSHETKEDKPAEEPKSDVASRDEEKREVPKVVEAPKGKLGVTTDTVYENAAIPDTEEGFEERIQKAQDAYRVEYEKILQNPDHELVKNLSDEQKEVLLGRMKNVIDNGFSPVQREAIIAAHLKGKSGVYELDLKEVGEKIKTLRFGKDYELKNKKDLPKEDIFVSEERRILLDYAIAGRRNRKEGGSYVPNMPESMEMDAIEAGMVQGVNQATTSIEEDASYIVEEAEDHPGIMIPESIGSAFRILQDDALRLNGLIQRQVLPVHLTDEANAFMEKTGLTLQLLGNTDREIHELAQSRQSLQTDNPGRNQQQISDIDARINDLRTRAYQAMKSAFSEKQRLQDRVQESGMNAPIFESDTRNNSQKNGQEIKPIGRREADAEDEPWGRALRSIEDVGHFMEKITPEYVGQVMAQLYVGSDDVIRDTGTEEEKLYAYKISAGEYAKEWKNIPIELHEKRQNNGVLMLTRGEIEKYGLDDKSGNKGGPIGRPANMYRQQGESKEFWEAVKVVRPDQFMNWMRSYWVLLHNDDPDNPADFFKGIIVTHPDARGSTNAENMHKASGTFLKSRFLVDSTSGDFRVYEKLKNQIINEVWVPSGERNNEVLFKAIMHADEELPKTKRDRIASGNLPAKTAAGGKNTMATIFSLPEDFQEDFDWKTGKTLTQEEKDETYDARLGTGILLAYEMYYNISDLEGLRNLVGDEASMFTQEAIARAVLEVKGEYIGQNLNKDQLVELIQRAKKHMETVDDNKTILDSNLYDSEGKFVGLNPPVLQPNLTEKEKEAKMKEYNSNVKKWIGYINPFFPPQKEMLMLAVTRKIVENQIQELTGLKKSASGSEIAELHAYLRTYHDSIAARHDTGMGNRNSESKYEFVGAPGGYQDKQDPRDRAGNNYNKGILWRTTVGMLHGMPTKNGETVQDILSRALSMQMEKSRAYNNALKVLMKENGESEMSKIPGMIAGMKENNHSFDTATASLLKQLDKAFQEKERAKEGAGAGLNYRIDNLQKRIVELQFRNDPNNSELKDLWKEYVAASKESDDLMNGRLQFDEAQYTQFVGMHYMNGTSLFHMEMNSKDLPLDKLRGRDFEGRIYFKTEEFGGWLEEMEKRMRYTIDTWKLPLGAMERRLVNPRGEGPPQFVDIPIIESIFGSYDRSKTHYGGVMEMAQQMFLRQAAEEVKRIRSDKTLTQEERDEKLALYENDLARFKFTDGKGNIVKLDKDGKPLWEETDGRRQVLREIVGYIDYSSGEPKKVKGIIEDSANTFVRAYVKVRIANYLASHTDKKTSYDRWPTQEREDFFKALLMSNYFTAEDIDDIRKFAKNIAMDNFKGEVKKAVKIEGVKGFFDGLKYFFSSGFK